MLYSVIPLQSFGHASSKADHILTEYSDPYYIHNTLFWLQVCSLSTIFRAHNSMVTSILLIQTRPKMSKTSPFPKRSNPMKKDREAMIKSMPGMTKGKEDRKMDRPMIIDSPGI